MDREHKYLHGMIAIASIFGGVCIALMFVIFGLVSKSNNYKVALENMYSRSLYELVSNINDIELDISKVISTTQVSTQRELLGNIRSNSTCAGDNLSSLPISKEHASNLFDILNHIGGYSQSLVDKLNGGGSLDNSNFETLSGLHSTALNLMYSLNEYMLNIDADYLRLGSVDFSKDDIDFKAGLDNVSSEKEGMPTLIYDGPFSESVTNKQVVGLGDREYSVDEAKEKLENDLEFFDTLDIRYIGDSDGKIFTYNFEVILQDMKMFVQVSKIGGNIIEFSAYDIKSTIQNIDEDSARLLAENLAKIFEIEDMGCVWQATNGTMSYINLAPIVNNVVYYSDLIKVKVDTHYGIVLGYDATNYYTNHKLRTLSSPKITLDTAKKSVSEALKIESSRLALIPDKYVGEIFCYEFTCSWKDYTYFVYIDAFDASEADILRVVLTTRGNLVV